LFPRTVVCRKREQTCAGILDNFIRDASFPGRHKVYTSTLEFVNAEAARHDMIRDISRRVSGRSFPPVRRRSGNTSQTVLDLIRKP
jgi:hypothetical protein